MGNDTQPGIVSAFLEAKLGCVYGRRYIRWECVRKFFHCKVCLFPPPSSLHSVNIYIQYTPNNYKPWRAAKSSWRGYLSPYIYPPPSPTVPSFLLSFLSSGNPATTLLRTTALLQTTTLDNLDNPRRPSTTLDDPRRPSTTLDDPRHPRRPSQ